MMAVIPRTDYIKGQFAFELKKILVHIKQPSTDKGNCFFFWNIKTVDIFGFLNSPKRGKTFVYETFANPASQDKKGKLIIIKNSISTGRIILK